MEPCETSSFPPPALTRIEAKYDRAKIPAHKSSGLPFCRAFVVMNFHDESVDFVMDFWVNFFSGYLGAFRPFKRRTEHPQRDPQQNSRQNPCKIHACSEKTASENPLCRKRGPTTEVIPCRPWKSKSPFACDLSRHLQESPDLPGPKSQKSLKKGLFGGPQKSLKKYPEKSKNTDFRTFLGIFRLFRVFFGTFLRTPKKTFLETSL